MKNTKLVKSLLSVFFLLLATYSTAFAQIQGDWDGDGTADLGVALVNRQANITFFQVNFSTGGALPSLINRAADAIVTGRFFSDRKLYWGIVQVTSAGEPLLWVIQTPNGGEASFRFGLPGDVVPNNQFDFDGDGITDPVVVRNNTVTGGKDWYFKLSTFPEGIFERISYGLIGDGVATGYNATGLGLMYALRNGFTWFARDRAGNEMVPAQWGLNGDIPLIPQRIRRDGGEEQFAFIVVRPTGVGQQAYIRFFDGPTRLINLGPDSSIPTVGNFTGLGADLGYHVREANAIGMSTVFIRRPDGSFYPVNSGIPSNIIVRPDSSIINPNESGRFGITSGNSGGGTGGGSSGSTGGGTSGGTVNCGMNVVSINSLREVLYKPVNEHGGRGPTFLVQNVNERTGLRKLEVRDKNCKPISSFGLYACDYPFGCRYYQGSGGGNHSASVLANLAGGGPILVQGKGKWIQVDNPRNRQGHIRK